RNLAFMCFRKNINLMKTITIPKTEYFQMKSTIQQLEEQYQKFLNKLEIMPEIREGFLEVKQAKKLGKPLQSLNDFLSEL
ncbi:MAG: hypothetical protein ACPG49_10515, partial [Chitinophagales bacterium]